jgi:HSP20 family molecular chaperone IbpA
MPGFPIDVMLDPAGYRVEIELPGVVEADINITLRGPRLIVHAERPAVGGDFLAREIERGLLVREILLPAAVDLVAARFEDGLLQLRLQRTGGD